MSDNAGETPNYTQFVCIGAGFSGIGLGASLKRKFGTADIRIFERESDIGGTWQVNQYPGAACDIPSSLYSFSFEPNPDWSRVLPPAQEIKAYLKEVAAKYSLSPDKITFNTSVIKCEWVDASSRWRLSVQDTQTQAVSVHECQFLFSGTGILVDPRDDELNSIPGFSSFQGLMAHSARWNPSTDLKGKNVVVFGNGCSGAQIVPAVVKQEAKTVTQIVRTKHWVIPALSDKMPLAPIAFLPTSIQRFLIATMAEIEFFGLQEGWVGSWLRNRRQKMSEAYMRATAPEKYHDLLIPEYEFGCKRRIYDSGYLKSLHSPIVTLTNASVQKILPDGLVTQAGEKIAADVIILATGFKTNRFVTGIEVVGRERQGLEEHWDEIGGVGAYDCAALSGFPNFFMLAGPNSVTAHTSVILAVENTIEYALRLIQPLLGGKAGQKTVEVTREAEQKFLADVQRTLMEKSIANKGGCRTWHVQVDEKTGKKWNGMLYPWWQGYYWYRCRFPVWKDWVYR